MMTFVFGFFKRYNKSHTYHKSKMAMSVSRHFALRTGLLRCIPPSKILRNAWIAGSPPLSRRMASVSVASSPIVDPRERYAAKLAATAKE